MNSQRIAVVTGATGQDGYLLVEKLLAEGTVVHALIRRDSDISRLPNNENGIGKLLVEVMDLENKAALSEFIRKTMPDEFYNLAGFSSVGQSLSNPLIAWQSNASVVAQILEALRLESAHTCLYQASSSEMFGWRPGESVIHNEDSVMSPRSPYAAAKAAAHLMCGVYRETYGMKIGCGILFNHESKRRSAAFLSMKVADHVRRLKHSKGRKTFPVLRVGNLKIERDWGYAPEYVDGIIRITRQLEFRSDHQRSHAGGFGNALYRDYVLGTGKTHAVWELIDTAFRLEGFELEWDLSGDEPKNWKAWFLDTRMLAVEVDPALLRLNEPLKIGADPTRARHDLQWMPTQGLDLFLQEMLTDAS